MSKIKNYYDECISTLDMFDDFDYISYQRDMEHYQEQENKQRQLEFDAMFEDYSYGI